MTHKKIKIIYLIQFKIKRFSYPNHCFQVFSFETSTTAEHIIIQSTVIFFIFLFWWLVRLFSVLDLWLLVLLFRSKCINANIFFLFGLTNKKLTKIGTCCTLLYTDIDRVHNPMLKKTV